jgi:hypothetical protein
MEIVLAVLGVLLPILLPIVLEFLNAPNTAEDAASRPDALKHRLADRVQKHKDGLRAGRGASATTAAGEGEDLGT